MLVFLASIDRLERAVTHPQAVFLTAIGISLSFAHNLAFFIPHDSGLKAAIIARISTVVDVVVSAAVLIRLAYHYSKALSKCKGLKTLFASILRFKDLTALWGKQPGLWDG